MNNQTIAIFADEDYGNKIHIFNIRQTTIQKGGFCCIRFLDRTVKRKLCGFQADCGSKASNKWTLDWIRDFYTFKNDCSTRRSVSHARNPNAKTPLGKPVNPEDEIGELFDGPAGQTSSEIQTQTAAFQAKVHTKKLKTKSTAREKKRY